MGNYSVEIAGFPGDEVNFSNSTSDVSVAVGESKIVSFDGTYLRTAILNGEVSAEGDGLEGVLVSLSGGPDKDRNPTTRTNKDGLYAFENLRGGAYQVGISDYDDINYGFDRPSRNVTLVLGGTATVDFEGTLLRTSGISGRVSVDGRGIPEAKVTLSGGGLDEDRTATTDVGGQYAFTGLAAGDYTVAISDVDTAAYVFEATSQDVKLGDDESKIVNFEGAHATTASISGHLYVDEATKNDAYDEGENRLEAAGIAVVLVGPNSLSERLPTATDAEGNFSFTGLRAGPYQLLVVPTPETTPANYGYGGLATGYAITLAVGQSVTQNIPFDITHQHVHFQVNLRNADAEGDALEGATVTLYSDAAGTSRISGAQATTDAEGVARLHFARAGATGHTAYASVTAPDGFGVGGDMQMVQWDAQSPEHQAENSQHVLNLNATFPFEGKTITTELGGGVALGEWAINVTHVGDDGKHEAVEGDSVPSALDADGKGTVEMSAAGVADLPMTYYVALADDQTGKDADGNQLDGGEKYETVDTITAVHDGLSVESTKETGTLEALYTTATIKMYVHQEVDQVPGYTGGIRGGDVRTSNVLDIHVLHIANNGRARALPESAKWSRPEGNGVNEGFVRYSGTGLVTFRNVPTQYDIVVSASRRNRNQNIVVLEPEEVPTYTALEENGVKGGAFGEQGGFHHTVELCPLQAVDPTGQHFGECASFAFANTYAVSGQAWRRSVKVNEDNDGFTPIANQHVPGTTVTVSPVKGSNIAGEANSFTAAASDNTATEDDERRQFNFGQMAQGVYTVKLPDGWTADVLAGDRANTLEADQFSLVQDTVIDVTPSTGTLYGRVVDGAGAPVSGATVTVNNVSDTTDIFGRYIIDGYGPVRSSIPARGTTHLHVTVSSTKGFDPWSNNPNNSRATPRADLTFAANNPKAANNIVLTGATEFTWINGTVTTPTGDPVAGAEIQVSYQNTGDGWEAPLNANVRLREAGRKYSSNYKGQPRYFGKEVYNARKSSLVLVTGADGTFRAQVRAGTPAQPQNGRLRVRREEYTIDTYDGVTFSAFVGNEISGYSFIAWRNAVIRGTVRTSGTNSRPLAGVEVTVETDTPRPDRPDGRYTAYTTGQTGVFFLNASAGGGQVTVSASREGYILSDPRTRTVVYGQTHILDENNAAAFTGTLTGSRTALKSVTVSHGARAHKDREVPYAASFGKDTTQVTVAAEATHPEHVKEIVFSPADANATAAGHQVNLQLGDNDVTITVTPNSGSPAIHTLRITRRGTDRSTAPQNLRASSPGSRALTFHWDTPSATGSDPISTYQWRRKIKTAEWPKIEKDGSGGGWKNVPARGTAVNGVTYNNAASGHSLAFGTDANLINGESYDFEVRARSASNNPKIYGVPASITASPWPAITGIAFEPTTIAEGADADDDPPNQTTLTITATEGQTALEDYKVRLSVPDAAQRALVRFDREVTIHRGRNTATVTVTALENSRDDGESTEVTFTASIMKDEADDDERAPFQGPTALTVNDNDTAPGAPIVTPPTGDDVGSDFITVRWSAATAPTDDPVTRYEIRWTKDGEAQPTTWTRYVDLRIRVFTITELESATTYDIEVRAVNLAGESDPGTADDVTTLASGS